MKRFIFQGCVNDFEEVSEVKKKYKVDEYGWVQLKLKNSEGDGIIITAKSNGGGGR